MKIISGILKIFRLPSKGSIVEALIVFAAFLIVAVPFGLLSGFLQFQIHEPLSISTLLFLLIVPCLVEELVFRGPLLLRAYGLPRFQLGAALLTLFVLWHPINTFLFMPHAADIFRDPRFLTIAFGLGLACTIVTTRSNSIWLAILIHWLTVVGGKHFFDILPGKAIT